jgi:exonuclease SbcC
MAHKHIVHISDIHIRFGSRHEEYTTVLLERTINDVRSIKPRRIVVTGDLFHIKINLSPAAIDIGGDFLRELSTIAPVDVILGNHDLNMQTLAQGNAIEPIIKLLVNGYTVSKDNPVLPKPENGHGIYFYKDSGFYNIDTNLVYGVYSCWDSQIFQLQQKEINKQYIALFHGPVYGCLGDNGYEMKGDDLVKLSTFNNYDMVMMGDIHEYQAFESRGVERIAYAGSLIQQNFGESLSKGYIVWDTETCTHVRRFIPNDYGYCRLNIYKGELWEDRLESLQFSLNKKKTKVDIVLHDDQENYSVEKLSQIEKYIRDRYGCESVSADYNSLKKDIVDSTDEGDVLDVKDAESSEKLLREFLEKNEYDNIDDVIELNKDIDLKLNIEVSPTQGMRIDYDTIEVSNLLSFPLETTTFDLNRIKGLTGIFGKNYNGKSNVMKVFVWICYGKMPGDMESSKLVNLYTGNNKGWGKISWTIAGVKYYAYRAITVKTKKDGSPDVSYVIEYKRYENVPNELTGELEWKWVDVESEKAATEKKEKKKRIIDYIGTYSDFMVSAMQTNDESYLSLGQQPKNDLINKFLGLEIYRQRYEFANETFKTIKSKQKVLGNPTELVEKIEETEKKINDNIVVIETLNSEKSETLHKIDAFNHNIIEQTKKLHKIDLPADTNKNNILSQIEKTQGNIKQNKEVLITKSEWLKTNFKRELSDNLKNLNEKTISDNLEKERKNFTSEKERYSNIEQWLKENQKKEVLPQEPIEESIAKIRAALAALDSRLKISKGEKCPTCNHVTHEPNPEMEKKTLEDIERGKKALSDEQTKLNTSKNNTTHNAKVDSDQATLEALKISMAARHTNIQNMKQSLELAAQKSSIDSYNAVVDKEMFEVDALKVKIDSDEKIIEKLKEQIVLLEKNEAYIVENSETNSTINSLKEHIAVLKTMNLQVESKIKECTSNSGAWNNELVSLKEKLDSIRETERIYKKYSIYLQAVGRDGIPALIIRKKLPIINHKINGLLKNMVSFKVELYMKSNGDVKEQFYFSDKKTDTLPLSMGSGSIKFITNTAISDALHFASTLIKPSIKVIDEGFDTLDNNKLTELNSMFDYLKSKYKNIFIITHKSEVRDYVDNIIEVYKNKNGITDPEILSNPEAGISQFNYV